MLLRRSINKTLSKAVVFATFITAIALFNMLIMVGCGEKETGVGKLKVAATIEPLADFCRNVGGGMVEVETLIPPGASPHTYELTSEQMKYLSDADVLLINGLNLIPWAEDILEKVDNPGLVKVAAGEAVMTSELIEAAGEHRNKDEVDGGNDNVIYDPHVWLDPKLAAVEVEAIRDGLIEADSANKDRYSENARDYMEELEELDGYIRDEVATFTRRKFVSFHPAWTYFAHCYGLEQVAVVEELPGKEPSAGEIAELIDTIREQSVQVIFTEPQFSPKAAETIAEESGADVVLKSLDPIGDPDDPDKNTYIKLMKYNIAVMGEAMR